MNRQTLEFQATSWWKPEWELVRNTQPLGTFSITKPLTYTEATATAAGKEWTISHSPWSWTYKIVVRDTTGKVVAETAQIGRWWKPSYQIELEGTKYTMRALSWSGMRYAVTDEHTQEVLALRLNWFGMSATIDMQNSNIDDTTALLLTFIAFYQTKIIDAQSSAAASGAVVANSS